MRHYSLFGCIVWLAAPAFGQTVSNERSAIVSELTACRAIESDAARLACFDRGVERLDRLVASNEVVLMDREEVRKTRRSLFGFSFPDLPFFRKNREGGEEEEISEITATVRSASADAFGKYTVRLEDGAVWRTTEPVKKAPKPGGEVTLKKAALGSYMMRIGGASGVRAMRVN